MEGESVNKTYNHIAFELNEDDMNDYREKIISLGLEILPDRNRCPEEGGSLYFYDYDNHLFDLHAGSLAKRIEFYVAN